MSRRVQNGTIQNAALPQAKFYSFPNPDLISSRGLQTQLITPASFKLAETQDYTGFVVLLLSTFLSKVCQYCRET